MSASREDFGIAIRSALLQRGARQKFSLLFLLCISILIFFLDTFQSKPMNTVRALLNDGIYRFSSAANFPFKFFSYVTSKSKEHMFVYKENIFLKKELEVLKSKDLNIKFLETENLKLREILNSQESDNLEYEIAKVILDKDSPYLYSVIINKGSRASITKGMAVIENKNLVGIVIEVNYLSSRVLLLNDLNSRIPVVISPSSAQAILKGAGKKEPILDYLPESYVAPEDATVFTSGKDGVFASGIPIGKIFYEEDKIKVKLFSDPNQLSFINIILNTSKEKL
jgi:rod shape-determining protein MreC|tara:strand:- start:498 stop:1346 length:849 start_codon:yes stop_codon:yes gene_type:complete